MQNLVRDDLIKDYSVEPKLAAKRADKFVQSAVGKRFKTWERE